MKTKRQTCGERYPISPGFSAKCARAVDHDGEHYLCNIDGDCGAYEAYLLNPEFGVVCRLPKDHAGYHRFEKARADQCEIHAVR